MGTGSATNPGPQRRPRGFWVKPPPLNGQFGADAEGIWAVLYRVGTIAIGLAIAVAAALFLYGRQHP